MTMASDESFVRFIADQLADAGIIVFRKMFGEYGLYCDGVFFGTVEDNHLYLKITEPGAALLQDAIIASPHEGAYYFLIEALDDRALLTALIRETCAALPPKKPKSHTRKKRRSP